MSRVLLVESGSRHLLEGVLPGLRRAYGEDVPVDVVTCYSGMPEGFPSATTAVFHVSDYRGRTGRRRLYHSLAANTYSILGIICSNEPIMTKWKWVIAAQLPAKVFVINENGDWFWLDRGHWSAIRHFALFRAGLTGSGALRTMGRILLFPFTLLYLLLYASIIHLRRAVRRGYR